MFSYLKFLSSMQRINSKLIKSSSVTWKWETNAEESDVEMLTSYAVGKENKKTPPTIPNKTEDHSKRFHSNHWHHSTEGKKKRCI